MPLYRRLKVFSPYWAAEPHVCPPVCIGDARDAHSRDCIEIQNNMDARHRFGIKCTMQLDAAEPWLHLDARCRRCQVPLHLDAASRFASGRIQRKPCAIRHCDAHRIAKIALVKCISKSHTELRFEPSAPTIGQSADFAQ